MITSAPVRKAAAKATLDLPFHIPAKEWFTLGEAAALCGMGESFMEKLFDAAAENGRGEIFGHRHNAGLGARMTKRVPRLFLVAYMVKTATYDNDALVDCVIASLRHCSREQQHRVHSALGLFLERK
ncbi:MAG TPA: hypothetical protein VHN79_03650 [Lacunisphaera sp.]|nr:hypothetical protein [Lacunisphaera sp.]